MPTASFFKRVTLTAPGQFIPVFVDRLPIWSIEFDITNIQGNVVIRAVNSNEPVSDPAPLIAKFSNADNQNRMFTFTGSGTREVFGKRETPASWIGLDWLSEAGGAGAQIEVIYKAFART